MFAMMSAIALTGAVSFSSCSSSDEVVDVNPTYDGESVKTSFTLSVGEVKAPTTRMASTAVQENKEFNGMTDIYLIPAKAAITGETTFTEDVIKLDDFTSFDKYSTGGTSTNAKIYNDVKLSTGVNNFLFYAAIPDGYKDNGELKPSYLKVDKTAFDGDADWTATTVFNQNATVGGITFDLVPYQKDKTISAVQTAGADVVAVLNAINTELTTQINKTGIDDNTKNAMKAKLSKLRNFVDLDNDGIQDEGETEYKAYAGSALSIKALAEDVYNFGKNLDNTYGEALCTAITGAGLTESGNATNGFTLSWTNNFPGNLNLPDGAVAVKYDTTNGFAYTDDVNIEGLTSPTISTYTHPARLYYTANTPAMVKDNVYLTNLVGNEPWSGDGDNSVTSKYTQGAITSNTKSVIMKDQVQYAVGRLDVLVRVDNTVNLKDNGSGIVGSSDKDPQLVSVPTAGYTLTGVLIGGQKQVDWQFSPVTTATEYTIWDKNVGSIAAKAEANYSAATHTLALETASEAKVRIALEFVNTGNDFYGINHNIIPKGTKFYLVADLDPKEAATISENTNNLNMVFKQDYITTAKLTIHETALQKAYNVIPDLRSPQLEFGFSVNLEWQKGITFTQTFQ